MIETEFPRSAGSCIKYDLTCITAPLPSPTKAKKAKVGTRLSKPDPSRIMRLLAVTGCPDRKCDEDEFTICSATAHSLLGEEGSFTPQTSKLTYIRSLMSSRTVSMAGLLCA